MHTGPSAEALDTKRKADKPEVRKASHAALLTVLPMAWAPAVSEALSCE